MVDFAHSPRVTWQYPDTLSVVTTGRRGLPLLPNRDKPVMFPTKLRSDSIFPTTSYLASNVNSTKIDKPCTRSLPTLGVSIFVWKCVHGEVELPQNLQDTEENFTGSSSLHTYLSLPSYAKC